MTTPAEDIVRAWDWLEQWGHEVNRVDLDLLDPTDLFVLLDAEQRRVKTLADEWEIWW